MLELISAIENRYLIKFKYKEESTIRKADVYILGLNVNGNLLIRAYEIGSGWKLFKVFELNEFSVTSTKAYGHKPGYKPSDKAFIKIIKKVV